MMRRSVLTSAVAALTVLTGCNSAESQPPARALAQAGEALNQLSGYHVVVESAAGTFRLDLDVRPPDSARGTFTLGSAKGQVRYEGGTLFGQGQSLAEAYVLDAQAAAYGLQKSQIPPDQVELLNELVDQRIGNRWFRGPLESVFSLATNPSAIAGCLSGAHGKLTETGKGSLGGYDVSHIADAGGDTAESYAVASSGPPYPVQIAQDGAAVDACHLGQGSKMTFSQFGERVFIDLPPRPYDTTKPGG